MHNVDISYLLPSLPGPLAESYLQETFGFQTVLKHSSPVYLFFQYSNNSFVESYQNSLKQFSSNCFVFSSGSRFCYVILALPERFFEIVSWAKIQTCSQLADHLEKKLLFKKNTEFQIGKFTWRPDCPRVMGILNITPDSFFDGGKFFKTKDFGEVAAGMIEEGADIIDIGGESTRPGSKAVSAQDELQRVLPAIEQIRNRFDIPISVDTVKPEVAEIVLNKGADMINDTSGLSAGEKMLGVLKKYNASYCLMHIQGVPEQMQENPVYSDVIADVYEFFIDKLEACRKAGIQNNKICIDPGIGFGKHYHHNLYILRFLSAFTYLNQTILLGTSNKSFIGKALNRESDRRLAGSLTTQVMGWLKGASIFRVHNIESTSDALKMASLYTDDYKI